MINSIVLQKKSFAYFKNVYSVSRNTTSLLERFQFSFIGKNLFLNINRDQQRQLGGLPNLSLPALQAGLFGLLLLMVSQKLQNQRAKDSGFHTHLIPYQIQCPNNIQTSHYFLQSNVYFIIITDTGLEIQTGHRRDGLSGTSRGKLKGQAWRGVSSDQIVRNWKLLKALHSQV